MYRIGNGFDAHRFKEGRKLIIGGCEIPYEFGLSGHSDADVLSHSISDALLGAASEGDLGKHFPSSDPQYKDISSLELLKISYDKIKEKGYLIENIDTTIICEKPKLAMYIGQMTTNLSQAMEISESQISVKATTTDGMGFTGRGEGISSYATVLLKLCNEEIS